jgi:UDP-3-O-[3-hydroxymyristoyl] N-acetylglucosamine deacetylase/UDP-3-O-[3-hydroxymyristoyl] N-acetylglucosamine deacetylase/3-hydroxyacyl-[acyl-carrier-protein] dehydratase
MQYRSQRTIRNSCEVSGIGFFTGADVTLCFLPAEPDHGIVFQRTDVTSPPIPATIEYLQPRYRRTCIGRDGVCVEMIEHVMATFSGLQIDNCLVKLNAPETPGFDGSSLPLAEALMAAGVEDQGIPRSVMPIELTVTAERSADKCRIVATPHARPTLVISYHLDYGPHSPIPSGELAIEINPATFLEELASARTFIMESEVVALRAKGYGKRTTFRDLLVFGDNCVIDNELRTPDECIRHKILDCLGDFALGGCDLHGNIRATRSGHRLNHELIQQLVRQHSHDVRGDAA